MRVLEGANLLFEQSEIRHWPNLMLALQICYKYTDLLIAFGIFVLMAAGAVIPWVTNLPSYGADAVFHRRRGRFYQYRYNAQIVKQVLHLNIVHLKIIYIHAKIWQIFFSFKGGNTMTMHLWGEATASPMNAVHFGFGLGAILAPQLAIPFLSPDAKGREFRHVNQCKRDIKSNGTFHPHLRFQFYWRYIEWRFGSSTRIPVHYHRSDRNNLYNYDGGLLYHRTTQGIPHKKTGEI